MEDFKCPICGSNECKKQDVPNLYVQIRCIQGYDFLLQNDILKMHPDEQDKIFNVILEYLLRKPTCDDKFWWFYYEKPTYRKVKTEFEPVYVNLFDVIQLYPANFIERANRTLANLAILYPQYGHEIGYNYIGCHAAYGTGEDLYGETVGFFELMVELGYLAKHRNQPNWFVISATGWLKYEELQKQQREVKQGFVAMSFRGETVYIREAFRKAINAAGYAVCVIDEKEHNNQIVPEIFYEINRSKFVVVDVTYPNYGAYYEAGYAMGMGKQVVVCCKKEVFDNKQSIYERPHFDISQKSMVIWEDEDDLVSRLMSRIRATIT